MLACSQSTHQLWLTSCSTSTLCLTEHSKRSYHNRRTMINFKGHCKTDAYMLLSVESASDQQVQFLPFVLFRLMSPVPHWFYHLQHVWDTSLCICSWAGVKALSNLLMLLTSHYTRNHASVTCLPLPIVLLQVCSLVRRCCMASKQSDFKGNPGLLPQPLPNWV